MAASSRSIRTRPSLVETGEVGETFRHPGKRKAITASGAR
jgi:hypothetical protein